MRFYEVRKVSNKVCLCDLIYSGDFPLLDVLEEDPEHERFFKVVFESEFPYEEGLYTSFNRFNKEADEKLTDLSESLQWILSDSDHRDDVRVVEESFYNELKEGSTSFIICEEVFQIEKPFSPLLGYIKATKAYHQLGDISREKEEYARVVGEDEENYYGYWIEGLGFIDVKFPKESSVFLSGDDAVMAERFASNCEIC